MSCGLSCHSLLRDNDFDQLAMNQSQAVLLQMQKHFNDFVDLAKFSLREYMVTNLRLMFVRSLVDRLRNAQTIQNHKEYLLAFGKKCKESRQVPAPVYRWS